MRLYVIPVQQEHYGSVLAPYRPAKGEVLNMNRILFDIADPPMPAQTSGLAVIAVIIIAALVLLFVAASVIVLVVLLKKKKRRAMAAAQAPVQGQPQK